MFELRPLVAANWKMNGSVQLAEKVTAVFSEEFKSNDVDVVICPPSVYLGTMQNLLSGHDTKSVQVGAQNLSEQSSGAFTGELSGAMLSEFGCGYVIVGHSERRSLYGEDKELVAKKYMAAQDAGLKPILCTGETESQREADETFEVIAADIDAVLNLAGIGALENGVIAYEPVWAIGTGKTASPQQAQDVHEFIRGHLAKHDQNVAASVRIIYGGSVNDSNAAELFSQKDINGALVGGASLVPEKFLTICEKAQRQS